MRLFRYTNGKQGNHLLVLGAIHGNEPCGPIAIEKVMKEIEGGDYSIDLGTVTFVPVCNPQAYGKGVRYIEENLNRLFHPDWKGQSYESELAKEICGLIDTCDYLLDIHSLSGGNNTFLFKTDYSLTSPVHDLAKASGIRQVIRGWSELYEDRGERATDDYAASQGIHGVCIECGHHEDPQAPHVAYTAITNMMKHLGILPGPASYIHDQETLHMEKLIYKKQNGAFTKDWKHGEKVRLGESIATYENGETIVAEKDMCIILPKHRAEKGEEWFYLGRVVEG